jgi:hypothetical protein
MDPVVQNLIRRRATRTTTIRRWILLLSLCLAATLSMAACTAGTLPGSARPGHTTLPAASPAPTRAASPPGAMPSVTPGGASASSAPPASAWVAASEIPFGATYRWSLVTGNGPSQPIGTAEGNGVYYVSPDTMFQAITSCGSPSLLLSTSLGAWQRIFGPASGAPGASAGQWISSYPDATAAQAAWHGLQVAYAGCAGQEGGRQVTVTETAQTQDAMAWFHINTHGAVIDLSPYVHEYFVLHENQIAYLYVEGAGPALATTPDDAQVLAAIARHLSA